MLPNGSQVARFTSVDASRGESLELEMIAASVIGGASLSGGVGSIVGTILGCLTLVKGHRRKRDGLSQFRRWNQDGARL